MKRGTLKKLSIVNIFILFFSLVSGLFSAVPRAEAAGFQETYVRLDRMLASTFTSGMVCARTPVADTAGTENDVQVVFPSDFTLSTTLTDWAVATDNLPTGATIWPGIAQATEASNATKTVTFPSTALSTNTLYCFRWTNTSAALQTGAAGVNRTGSVTTRTNVPATIDTTSYATAIVSNYDQITLSATVTPTFSYALDGNTSAFGNLTTVAGGSSATARTVTISTNATNGWVTWVKSASAALTSVSSGGSIATAGTVNDTPEDLDSTTGYILDVDITSEGTIGDGDVTQQNGWGAEYNGADATQGGSLSTNFEPIAASDGTSDSDVLTLYPRARITAVQIAAADYTDTLTVVAAGRF